jgi:late competence protein required for DNA uptake (superfamily II DNA/RNA helicase)
VQKAVETKTILTEDEILRNLEARRVELVQKLRDGEQRIQTTRTILERKFTSSVAMAGLVKVKNDICSLAKSTDEALQTLAKEEPLVCKEIPASLIVFIVGVG